MPNYTENLQLVKPLQSEQYNIDVFNANADKIDQFAGQVPPRALIADKLTTGAKINGVNFKGDTDVVTGAGFYYDTVTYGAGDLAFIYNQDSALELHKSLSAGNIGHNPLTSTGYWEKQDLGGGGGRNVGEIIQSALPLTDAGLHLLDGTRLSGDGIYGEFVQYIADLYTENPTANYFCTETEWQASITQYGVCGKFVYDSTLNTVRLPKVTGIIEGTTDVNALGDLVEAGLPSHKHNLANNTTSNTSLSQDSYLSYRSDIGGGDYKYTLCGNSTSPTLGVSGEANNSIYGNSNTVQPQTIKCFVYIVIASSTKTDVQVDIDEIATDLNGKADTDLSNTTPSQSFKNNSIRWVMPDYANGISLVGLTTYTCPSDGWIDAVADSGTGYRYIYRNGDLIACMGTGTYLCGCFFPVFKNDVITVSSAFYGDTYFYPAKGV